MTKIKLIILTIVISSVLSGCVTSHVPTIDDIFGDAPPVATQYRRVANYEGMRSLDESITILKNTNTDIIYQAWIRQNPCPEKCTDLPSEQQLQCVKEGYSFEHLEQSVYVVKKEMPETVFVGGMLAEFLNKEAWNEKTGEKFGEYDTWNMALNPSKWGLSKTKTQFQTEWAVSRGWVQQGQPYNPKEEMYYYYPDISNPDFQELFLSYAKRQIDAGVDAIWIDMFYSQAELMAYITDDINHPAVKESYEASNYITNEIHDYGKLRGKKIQVITWAHPIMFKVEYDKPDLDGIMMSIGTNEIKQMRMNELKWDTEIANTRKVFGDKIPIYARIDYGGAGSPLSVFSQELNIKQANQFLIIADDFFIDKDIIFIYPVFGGNMGALGKHSATLSYGKFDWYDSMAPEFQTYDTIVALSKRKKS